MASLAPYKPISLLAKFLKQLFIITFSETWVYHYTHIASVLEQLRKAGLTANHSSVHGVGPLSEGHVVGEGFLTNRVEGMLRKD